MFKKLISYLLVATLTLSGIPAYAGIDDAFSSLVPGTAVSVNSPGNYSSGARNSFMAGGVDLRVPRQSSSPAMFSVTPPRIAAGCNGISAHFGGFSFISGAEFEQMLKSIASGAALGFVSHLTMKTLCPACESVVQYMKNAAQQAARLSKDSCQWGKDMAAKYMDTGSGSTSTSTESVCGTAVSFEGKASDFLLAVKDQCNSLNSAIDELVAIANPSKDKSAEGLANEEAALCSASTFKGNITWAKLKAFDSNNSVATTEAESIMRKQIIMNLIGIELKSAGSDTPVYCTKSDGSGLQGITPGEDGVSVYCPPAMDADQLMGLFMCGAPTAGGFTGVTGTSGLDKSVINYCKTYFTPSASTKMLEGNAWACADSASCNIVKSVKASDVFKDTGFLIHVHNTLQKGVSAVRENKEMPVEVLNLIQVAPYPLYQAINAAAVYPSASSDLLASMSTLIAESMAMSYFDEMVKVSGRNTNESGCLTEKSANQILDLIAASRARAGERKTLMAQSLTIQEGIAEQIRSLNLSIQKQVMSADLLSNSQMSQAINQSFTTTGSSPSP